MRVIVQRVIESKVVVDEKIVSEIKNFFTLFSNLTNATKKIERRCIHLRFNVT